MHELPSSPLPEREVADELRVHDVRKLPCPQPLEMALDLANALAPGQSVRLLTPQYPTPLLALLAEQGLQTRVFTLPDGDVCVQIHRPGHDGQARG
ncbi:MAG: DUF2249 domain-containing protein [Rhodanobacter sp.]|jgi:hypothetical protein